MKRFRYLILILIVSVSMYVSLAPSFSLDRGKDKIAHFFFYGVITFLIFPSFSKWSFVISSFLAASMELLQGFTRSRYPSVYDFYAGFAGALVFYAISIFWRDRSENSHSQTREHKIQHDEKVARKNRSSLR